MDQNALTVLSPIKLSEVESLKKLLNEIGDDIKDNKYIPFSELSTTHFARWVIIPEVREKGYKPYLAFESNYDGNLDDYLEEFARKAGDGLDRIYSHCEGYPAEGTKNLKAFKQYIRDHSIKYSAFYIAYRGRTVQEIHNNTRVRGIVEDYLDAEEARSPLAAVPPMELRNGIQKHLREAQTTNPGLAIAPRFISNTWRVVTLVLLLAAALLILFPFPVFWLPLPLLARLLLFFTPLLLLGLFLVVLRMHERADDQMKVQFVPVGDAIVGRENYQVQNQLTHLVDIKSGRFRLYTLKAVFWIINSAAKFFWYKGDLGSIPTIHFARWVIIDNNKRLLFFSNFDGSWENYLGDFIDKAAVGLTAVWSNTVGFPDTKFLILEGATDEERFKEWARRQQIPTQVWYSAHANETAKNILNNVEIRNHVEPTLNEQQTEQWLQRF